jgi:hypothetical protein
MSNLNNDYIQRLQELSDKLWQQIKDHPNPPQSLQRLYSDITFKLLRFDYLMNKQGEEEESILEKYLKNANNNN